MREGGRERRVYMKVRDGRRYVLLVLGRRRDECCYRKGWKGGMKMREGKREGEKRKDEHEYEGCKGGKGEVEEGK